MIGIWGVRFRFSRFLIWKRGLFAFLAKRLPQVNAYFECYLLSRKEPRALSAVGYLLCIHG